MADELWIAGIWDEANSTDKSFKVRMELPPKGWGFIPKKKVTRTVVLSHTVGNTPYQWVGFLVTKDWIELARIPHLAIQHEHILIERFNRKELGIIGYTGEPGDSKPHSPLYVATGLPDRRGDSEF